MGKTWAITRYKSDRPTEVRDRDATLIERG